MGRTKAMVNKILKKPSRVSNPIEGSLPDIQSLLMQLDGLIQAKQDDLATEGRKCVAENQYKLGVLRASYGLMLRAKVLLEDYDIKP